MIANLLTNPLSTKKVDLLSGWLYNKTTKYDIPLQDDEIVKRSWTQSLKPADRLTCDLCSEISF